MPLSSFFVDLCLLATDGMGLSTMALIRRDKSDTAVAVLVITPIHKRRHPAAGFFLALEGPPGVVQPVFQPSGKQLRVGVVIAQPRPGEGSEHPQLLQAALQRRGPHGIAVIHMEDRGVWAALADSLPQAGPAQQLSGDLGVCESGHVRCHHYAASDVDDQVEIQPHSTHTGWKAGDVPTSHLIQSSGLQP
jgi:hypothetical protein